MKHGPYYWVAVEELSFTMGSLSFVGLKKWELPKLRGPNIDPKWQKRRPGVVRLFLQGHPPTGSPIQSKQPSILALSVLECLPATARR